MSNIQVVVYLVIGVAVMFYWCRFINGLMPEGLPKFSDRFRDDSPHEQLRRARKSSKKTDDPSPDSVGDKEGDGE